MKIDLVQVWVKYWLNRRLCPEFDCSTQKDEGEQSLSEWVLIILAYPSSFISSLFERTLWTKSWGICYKNNVRNRKQRRHLDASHLERKDSLTGRLISEKHRWVEYMAEINYIN